MKFSKRIIYYLFALLILLCIILHYPTTPHEIGRDSFEIHCIANSVSTFGYAKWWIHPASISGFYPYSYASAVPFVLSGITQCTEIDTEWTIWLFAILIGIFSAFTAYLMAGAIRDDDIFKYLVAFTYSTSTGMLYFTTWTVSTRGTFIVLFPLFIYLLLKCRVSLKYVPFTIVFFIVLSLIHHLFYFAIPVVVSYLIVTFFYKLNRHVSFDRIPKKLVCFAPAMCILGSFLIPFFTRTFIDAGSRYDWLEMMLSSYGRMIGLLIIFTVSGLGYLFLKGDKKFEDWFLIVTLTILAPLLYISVYARWGVFPFVFLVIGIALTNVAILKTRIWKKKHTASLLVVILLLSIIFSGYYQYIHFLDEPNPNKRYMAERTYVGALWIKGNIDTHKKVYAERVHVSPRLFAISEVPTLTGENVPDLAYDFVDPNELGIKQIYSPSSAEFYLRDPYKASNDTAWSVEAIEDTDINYHHSWAYRLTSKFNLSYFVENQDRRTPFAYSVSQMGDKIYENGKISIWS